MAERGDGRRIALVGLGYVGLPLALALGRYYPVLGFDVSRDRIRELRDGEDRSGEVAAASLRASTVDFTDDTAELAGSDVFIVTVPTPVDADNKPDLSLLRSACATVGSVLAKGNIVVFESTVYPGVTETVCGPELERAAGLVAGKDFFLGYSPERINPGDGEHTVERITKVVAGQNEETTRVLAEIYGAVTGGNIFIAKDIRTAEAAKVIENAQRDLNIAFVNELSMIFNKAGLSTHDVLAAAGSKWNFLPFTPGLVGGHCIGVDPYYLASLSRDLGHEPEVILAGRRTNEQMPAFVAEQVHQCLDGKPSSILVLGLTFKENVADIRNSKSADLVRDLASRGHRVDIHDPLADAAAARREYGLEILTTLDHTDTFDCVVGAVRHDVYREYSVAMLGALLAEGGLLVDLKSVWRHVETGDRFRRWNL